MNRLENLFKKTDHKLLNIFCTAGYPQLTSTVPVIEALQFAGADMVEIGMPYSDPVADGPVIQESNSIALMNGMNIQLLFDQLKKVRDTVSIPLVLMGYLNPIMQFGEERFFASASAAGIDGVIIPDLPLEEYEFQYRPIMQRYGLSMILMITPETGNERIMEIDRLSTGFIYAVSSSSTTGSTVDHKAREKWFLQLQEMKLRNPVMGGFGISNRNDLEQVQKHTAGGIIGSAYILALRDSTDIRRTTNEFIKRLRA